MIRILSVVLFCAGLFCLAQAQVPQTGAGRGTPGGGTTSCAPATTFIARTTTGNYNGNATDVSVVTNFICGMVTDGLISSAGTGYCGTQFDIIYFFAVHNSTDSLLNLCSSSFTATVQGSPVFTSAVGWNGVISSAADYLETGFTLSTSGNFAQNNAHVSVWSNTAAAVAAASSGVFSAAANTSIYPKFSDNNAYYRINDNIGASSSGIPQASGKGYFLANRSGASTQNGYYNGADQGVVSVASAAAAAFTMEIFVVNNMGSSNGGSNVQLCAFTLGTSLTAPKVSQLYSRLNTATSGQSCT